MDIEPDTYMINPMDIERHITKKTKAIIAVHLYGQSLPIEEIENAAKKHSLVLIEDAAQSYGAYYNTRSVGSMGDVSCVSFDPMKTTGSFGNGGMLLTDDEKNAECAIAMSNHGRFNNGVDSHVIEGCRSKMSSAEAGMLTFRLNDMKNDISERSMVANIYNMELSDISNIVLPYTAPESTHVWQKYIMLADDAQGLQDFLKQRGIGTRIWKTPMYKEPIFKDYVKEDLVTVDRITKQIIGLPIYAEITDEEAIYVVETIKDYYG